jgi:signal transduction histidine kinase
VPTESELRNGVPLFLRQLNSLSDVRVDSGLGQRHRVSVSEIVRDAEVEAAMGADVGAFMLTVFPVAADIEVAADPQILAAAIGNLLQNAFKFNRPHGQVLLRTIATADRVLIEVEDECGGLPPGSAEDMFRPFQQRSATRTGLGLGLTISRKGIEAMGGTLSVRDLPGKGCVFSIELPRLPA